MDARTHILAADAAVLLDPVERVIHQTAVAPHVVRVAVHQLLRVTNMSVGRVTGVATGRRGGFTSMLRA